jgi:transposase
MGRRRIVVADVKETLVQWDTGGSISGIAQRLGYSRPTVRKYVQAGQRIGLVRGSRRVDEVGWERAARAAIAQVAAEPRMGDASLAIVVGRWQLVRAPRHGAWTRVLDGLQALA